MQTSDIEPSNGVSRTQSHSDSDRLYDLLSKGQQEHGDQLRDLGLKLDKVVDGLSGMQGEIQALQVTPSLIKLIAVALILGVVGLGALVGRSVAVDGFGLHAGTSEAK